MSITLRESERFLPELPAQLVELFCPHSPCSPQIFPHGAGHGEAPPKLSLALSGAGPGHCPQMGPGLFLGARHTSPRATGPDPGKNAEGSVVS